jgi:hypothetical protein
VAVPHGRRAVLGPSRAVTHDALALGAAQVMNRPEARWAPGDAVIDQAILLAENCQTLAHSQHMH